ncbi:MAG: PH domain-containing protein [Longimicrobiales bacterium]
MTERLRALVLRLLRVPAQPQAPAGDPASVLTFRASPRYFQYRVALWCVTQLAALAALIGGALFLRMMAETAAPFWRFNLWGLLELCAWVAFAAQLPVTFMLLRLDFEMRWYLLSDRSLRIREGTLVVREKTMAYANIQNISIRRNPLQRIFGLATVAVRAAGGGSGTADQKGGSRTGMHTHEAHFEGVDNGDEIRDILRQRIRRHRDSGLGDPDDVQHETVTSPALIAARALVDEACALRAALTG